MATDCGDGDYLGAYRRFFEDFVDQVDPDDQLPVKVSAYDLTEAEITGEIIDWTLEYLNQKYCPPSLQSYLVHLVMEEVKLICSEEPEACGWRFQENTFAPLRLMQVVTGKVNEICQRYLDNSRLALLPPPPSTPIPLVSRCAIKNSRRKMEDRHVVIHDLNSIFGIQDESVVNYYAVFDGHAGQDAAVYCAAHLHQYLAESNHYPTDPERALRDAFLTTDAHFIEKSNKQNLNSGTTAVCALLLNRKLYIAWVGDSQAVLAKRGQITQLVNPHKPDRDDERERVNEMGGAVMHWGIWRVNGQLAVSRAIGDVQYKPYVTGDPDVRCIPLDGTEDFLIVACDGLWDFVSEAMATTLVYQQLREDPRDLEAVSQRLVCYAKSHGSTDNISAIVVFLTNPRQIAARHPSAHPLLADVQLNNMEPTNPFLSNANNGLQFDINSFGKQQEQQQEQEQQQPRNGTCPDLKNEEDVWYEGFRNPPPSNGKLSSIDDIGANFKNEFEKNPKKNIGDEDDDDEDDDDDDDLGPETDVDAVDLGFDLSNQQTNENLSRELFPEKHEHGELIETKEETNSKDELVAPLQPKEPDQHALITEADNVADSEDSEDEWNYYPNKEKDRISTTAETGERKNEKVQITAPDVTTQSEEIINRNKTRSPEPPGLGAGDSYIQKETELPELIESEICAKKEIEEEEEEEEPERIVGGEREEDMDFQLNPDAAEFVPVSPPKILTARANLNDDFPLSGSPQKQTPEMDDISLPSQREFQHEVCLRPHDMMESSSNGGNQSETTKEDLAQTEFTDYLMDRQKNINIPAFGLDESEVSSTKAEFGDESTLSFVTATDFHKTGCTAANEDSLNSSELREDYDIATDPMAMSFTPGDFEAAFEKSCDLNVVHQLHESDLTGEEEDTALHPELSSLVTPDGDNPPPTSAFPETRGDDEGNPESPEPLIKNDSILLSGMVELINPVDNDTKIFDEEQLEQNDYHALDTSSPLQAEENNKEQEQPTFCSLLGAPKTSSIADLDQDIETCLSPSNEIIKSSSPAPEDQILSPEVPASPLMAVSPSPCDEPETAVVSEETPIPEPAEPSEVFGSGNEVEKKLAEPLLQFGNETADKNFDASKLEEEINSAIIESDISRDVIDTPPPSQKESNNETQIANSSPDEQFKLVLDETVLADSPAEKVEKLNIYDEFKSEPSETGKENNEEPVIADAIDHVDVNKEVKEIEDLRVSEKASEQLLDMEEKVKQENIPEPEIEARKEEAVESSLEATSPFHKEAPELAEFETLETLVDEQLSTANAPVMNLSESMQEFTGLEQQLNPEPEATVPLSNGIIAPEVEEKSVIESQSHVGAVAAAVDLIEDKIIADQADEKEEKKVDMEKEFEKGEEKKEEVVSVDDKTEDTAKNVDDKKEAEPVLEPEETEKVVSKIEEEKEKTESKTEATPVDVPLAAAAAAAVGVAAVAGVTAVAGAKTTKAKPGVKAAPRSAATVKTSNKSTPTSPTKGASAAPRTTTTTTSSATAAKKPTAAARPKQLETGKTASVGTTTKTTAPKSTVASKTTTTASTLNKSSAHRANATATTTTTTKPRIGSSATAASKLHSTSADKKPTTNGDAKAPSKTAAAPKLTTRNLTNTTSVSPKPPTKTSTAPRPASASLSTTANHKSRPPLSSISTAKAKPAASGTSTSASPRPKTAPTSIGAKPKPAVSSTRSPATDKQTKETTNKQLSSNRTSTSTLAKSGRASMTGTTGGATTLAKRSLSGKNVPAAATAQPQKKPAPITRPGGKLSTKTAAAAAAAAAAATTAGKTTTTTTTTSTVTVTENLVQNGVSESHEIKTVVSNVGGGINVEEDVPQKDVSPITTSTDNQLIMTAD